MKSVLITLTLTFVLQAANAQQPAPHDADWKAPAKAAERKSPLAGKPEAAIGGGKVFERDCASCHGTVETRTATKAPDLASADVQAQTDGELFWKITNGNVRKGMPAWGSIPEPQRWQIVLYLRALAADKK